MDELQEKMNQAVRIMQWGVVLEFAHENMAPDEIVMEFGGKMYLVRLPREIASKGEQSPSAAHGSEK